MSRCVNCGLTGKRDQMTKKVLHSDATDFYYEVILCKHCEDEEHITVQYGGKHKLTEEEVKRLLFH